MRVVERDPDHDADERTRRREDLPSPHEQQIEPSNLAVESVVERSA